MDIFAGSLPFKSKEKDLQELFSRYGEVESVTIIIDKVTRQNKGFGFVVMPNDEEALKAISELNGKEWMGRTIVVNKSERKRDGEKEHTFRGDNKKRTGKFNMDGFKKGNTSWGFDRGGGYKKKPE